MLAVSDEQRNFGASLSTSLTFSSEVKCTSSFLGRPLLSCCPSRRQPCLESDGFTERFSSHSFKNADSSSSLLSLSGMPVTITLYLLLVMSEIV